MDLVKSTNSKFSEKYILSDELGRGEFSIVRKCIQILTRQDYAAKIIKTQGLSKRSYDKLEREAKICRLLNHHPNIIRLHEVIVENDCHYLLFDMALGGELFDDIIAKKCYSEWQATCYIQQILDGVRYCHEKNVVHRDLKPENILIHRNYNGDVTLKIADFGLAIQMRDESDYEWFGFAGTPGYLSPEVLSYQKYGKPVDAWSCGVIFYIFIVGYPPFWDDDKNVLFAQIKSGRFHYPQKDWSRISARTKHLISSLLVLNARMRMSVGEALKIAVSNRNQFEIEKNIIHRDDDEQFDWKEDYKYVF